MERHVHWDQLTPKKDFEAARTKAMKCGAVGFFLEDLKREFVEELIYRKLCSTNNGVPALELIR